jgi:hypothetical protein
MIILVVVHLNFRMLSCHFSDGYAYRDEYKELKTTPSASESSATI